jgi:type I restriction enzyme S subunit
LLKTIKTQLTVYRQAVLKWAFSDLSETDQIAKITSLVTSGSRGWAKYYSNNGAKFIRIGNLKRYGINIDLTDIQYVTLPQKVEGARSLLMENDVLISITADLGSIGFVETDLGEAYINQHIALVRFKNKFQSKFYAWFLRSDKGQKELLKNKRGAGKLGLGLDDIRNTKVPIITDEEAICTLQKIESRLSACDKLEQTIDQTLALSASLRQSILKKAFEGRLVLQNTNDEPAEKLLERIKAEKAAVLAKQKQTRKRGRK